MTSLVVDVDVGSLHVGQTLKLDLEFFGNVVRGPETVLGIHDDVDLHDQTGAGMVGPHSVDLLDGRRVRHGCTH